MATRAPRGFTIPRLSIIGKLLSAVFVSPSVRYFHRFDWRLRPPTARARASRLSSDRNFPRLPIRISQLSFYYPRPETSVFLMGTRRKDKPSTQRSLILQPRNLLVFRCRPDQRHELRRISILAGNTWRLMRILSPLSSCPILFCFLLSFVIRGDFFEGKTLRGVCHLSLISMLPSNLGRFPPLISILFSSSW